MRLITLDFETYYDDTYSLKKLTTEAYIRDPRFQVIGFAYKIDDEYPVWVSGEMPELARALRELNIHECALLAHHAAFDGAILSWIFGIRPKYYFDTLSMARPMHGLTVGGSLAALATTYKVGTKGTEVVNAKGLRREGFDEDQLSDYGSYCCNDVQLTYEIFDRMRPSFPKKELYIIDLMMRMYCDPVLELDREVLERHLVAVRARKQELLETVDRMFDDVQTAIMSNPKFAELLRLMGVEPPTKTSPTTGKETWAFAKTDERLRELLEHPDQRVQAVVAARLGLKSTIEETRTESFIGIADRGPLPVPLSYYGAHTGRASGWDKINLQNLPRGGELRRAISAPAGHVLVAVDSSQIEARVTAWLAGQVDLVEDFGQGVDIYSKFATTVYSREISKADKVERFVGKTCILGLGYGMGGQRLRDSLKSGAISVDMDIGETKRLVQIYRRTYASIAALWEEAQNYLDHAARGFVYEFGSGIRLLGTPEGVGLPNGMMVRYPGLRREGGDFVYMVRGKPVRLHGPKVIENVVQALARIVVFDQMARIDQQLRQRDRPQELERYRVVSTVHDEVIACVPEHYADTCLALMAGAMSAAPGWARGLPVACEGATGINYSECK